jgi:hypothetical protein
VELAPFKTGASTLLAFSTIFSIASCTSKSEQNGSAGTFKIIGKVANTSDFSDVTVQITSVQSGLTSKTLILTAAEERPNSSGELLIGVEIGCYNMSVIKPGFRSRGFENVCVNDSTPEYDLGQIGLSVERRFVMTASLDKYVFMAGGYNSDSMYSTVDVLDVTTGKMDVANLSKRRARGVGVAVGNKAIFAGGEACESEGYSSCAISSIVDIFDISSKTWSATSLSTARLDLAAGVTSDGYAVFAGGSTATGASNVVDIFNSNTGAWSTATLPAARFGMSAIAVGTKIFFAGGSGPDSSGVTKTTRIDVFEPSTGIWTVENLSVARRYFPTVKVGTKLLFAGGQLDCWPCSASGVVDIYDISNGSWSTATLSTPRELLVGASDGVIAVFAGGEANGSQGTDKVDIYDSSTDTWSTSVLSQARTNIAVAVNGNKAYFVGGNLDSQGFSNVIDVFDFASKSFVSSSF